MYPLQNFWEWLLKFYNSTVFLFLPPFATPLFKVRAVGKVIWGGPHLANLGNTHILLNGKFPKGKCQDHNRNSLSSGICFPALIKRFLFCQWCSIHHQELINLKLQHLPPQASGNLTVMILPWGEEFESCLGGMGNLNLKCQVFSAE